MTKDTKAALETNKALVCRALTTLKHDIDAVEEAVTPCGELDLLAEAYFDLTQDFKRLSAAISAALREEAQRV